MIKQDPLTRRNVPTHMHQYAVDDKDAQHYYDLVTNWTKLSKLLKDMDETTVATALVVELRTRKRLHIIHALQTRYKSVRSKAEDAAMVEVLVNQGLVG